MFTFYNIKLKSNAVSKYTSLVEMVLKHNLLNVIVIKLPRSIEKQDIDIKQYFMLSFILYLISFLLK